MDAQNRIESARTYVRDHPTKSITQIARELGWPMQSLSKWSRGVFGDRRGLGAHRWLELEAWLERDRAERKAAAQQLLEEGK